MTSTVAELLPISDTIAPGDAAGIAQTIADCFHDGTPVYPVGGGTRGPLLSRRGAPGVNRTGLVQKCELTRV